MGQDVIDSATLTACESVTDTSTLTNWYIEGLPDDTEANTQNGLTWNYCYPVNDAGDTATTTMNGETLSIANPSEKYDAIKWGPAEGSGSTWTVGLTLVQPGTSVCDESDGTKWSLSTTIYCVEGQDTPIQQGQAKQNGCTWEVAYTGDQGCPTVSAEATLNWFEDNPWAIGIVLVIVGPFIGLMGLKLFPWVSSVACALFGMGFLFLLFTSFGWTDATAGFWTSLSFSVLLGIIAGVVVKKNIWLAIGLLGIIGGAFSGILLLDFIAVCFDWSPEWALYVFAITGGIVGFVAGFKLGAPVVNVTTSFIGAYLFTRALTLFFCPDEWPSESDMISGTVDYDALGW